MSLYINQILCNHDWEIIDDTVIPSEADHIKGMGYAPQTTNSFERQYVKILQCKKCGKLVVKKFKTKS